MGDEKNKKVKKVSAGPSRVPAGERLIPEEEIARRYKRHLGAVSVGKREVADPDASVPKVTPRRAAERPLTPPRDLRGLGLGLGRPSDDDDDDDDVD